MTFVFITGDIFQDCTLYATCQKDQTQYQGLSEEYPQVYIFKVLEVNHT